MTQPDQPAVFAELLRIWQSGPGEAILAIVTADYRGHMLHLGADRDRAAYPDRIDSHRAQFPAARFEVVDQSETGDRLFSRIEANRTSDGVELVSHGMNVSRFVDGLIAEEWAIWTEWRETP